MPNSYEHSYQHDLDNVIDASDAVLAIGTEKVDSTTLKDRSLNNNDATIYGAMPSNGYFLGRRFDGDADYLDCGNFQIGGSSISILIIYIPNRITSTQTCISKESIFKVDSSNNVVRFLTGENWGGSILSLNRTLDINKITVLSLIYDGITKYGYTNGEIDANEISTTGSLGTNSNNIQIGNSNQQITHFVMATTEILDAVIIFNTLARLQLYSHNFERYPNSDTSLTSVFPYTSGIITSGSFNKTDGLKCTSAGQIIFSNSFEFDGSEYITLVIDGVEYSGTTTVTQGTITATIAQGSNDITIDMGTGDVLPDIRIQFREEV